MSFQEQYDNSDGNASEWVATLESDGKDIHTGNHIVMVNESLEPFATWINEVNELKNAKDIDVKESDSLLVPQSKANVIASPDDDTLQLVTLYSRTYFYFRSDLVEIANRPEEDKPKKATKKVLYTISDLEAGKGVDDNGNVPQGYLSKAYKIAPATLKEAAVSGKLPYAIDFDQPKAKLFNYELFKEWNSNRPVGRQTNIAKFVVSFTEEDIPEIESIVTLLGEERFAELFVLGKAGVPDAIEEVLPENVETMKERRARLKEESAKEEATE